MSTVTFQSDEAATLPADTDISFGSGVDDAGTQRVILPTDQFPLVTVTSNPTLTSGASIVTGDFVGVNATPWSWANAVRTALTGTITKVVVADQSLQSIPMELWLFSETVTVPNDSAAWNLSDADSFKCIGVIDLSSWRASTNASVCTVSGLALDIVLAATTLYGALVARGSATFATTALRIAISIRQD